MTTPEKKTFEEALDALIEEADDVEELDRIEALSDEEVERELAEAGWTPEAIAKAKAASEAKKATAAPTKEPAPPAADAPPAKDDAKVVRLEPLRRRLLSPRLLTFAAAAGILLVIGLAWRRQRLPTGNPDDLIPVEDVGSSGGTSGEPAPCKRLDWNAAGRAAAPTTLEGSLSEIHAGGAHLEPGETFFVLRTDPDVCGPDGKPVPAIQVIAASPALDLASLGDRRLRFEGIPRVYGPHEHRPVVFVVSKAAPAPVP